MIIHKREDSSSPLLSLENIITTSVIELHEVIDAAKTEIP